MTVDRGDRRHASGPPFALAAAVLLGLAVPAGALQAQPISVGLNAGLAASRHVDTAASWPDDIVSSRRLGAVAGITASFALPHGFEVRTEVQYVERGARRAEGEWARLTYLEMPVLLRAHAPDRWLPDGAPARPFLDAGIAPARELGCSGEVRPPPHAADDPRPLEPVDCTTVRSYRGDLGLVFGGGFGFTVGGLDATAELRYTRGTTDLVRHLDHRERYNRSLALIAGVQIPLRLWGG